MMNLRLVIRNVTRWVMRHMHWCTMWCLVMRLRPVFSLHSVNRNSSMVRWLVMHCWSVMDRCLSIGVIFLIIFILKLDFFHCFMLFRLRFRHHAIVLFFCLFGFSDTLCLRLFLWLLNNLFFTLLLVYSWLFILYFGYCLGLFALASSAPGEEFFVIEHFLI